LQRILKLSVFKQALGVLRQAKCYGDGGAGEEGSYGLAAVTTRTVFDSVTAEYTYSYVFCANDGDFFSNELLGNASYANFEIMSALINNISRVDDLQDLLDMADQAQQYSRMGGAN
jgi:hypothetical protein